MGYLDSVKQGWKGLMVATGIGIFGVLIRNITGIPILDPLLVSMAMGIVIRAVIKFSDNTIKGFSITPSIFIPPGIILYGAVSLNFTQVMVASEMNYILILLIVFIVHIISALVLSNFFGLNERTGYLIATGSSICGASAITIASKAIDAKPNEVSISLLSVFISALIGLFIILPLSAEFLKISEIDYGAFSGSVLQFTGFVKASVARFSLEAKSIALSIKALRYIGLLFVIPLFSSFIKGRIYIPWYLWGFLGAGVLFSVIPDLTSTLKPVLEPTLKVLWSIAMGAIGLNSEIKKLFTKNGSKALMVSFFSFIIAVITFLVAQNSLLGSNDILF